MRDQLRVPENVDVPKFPSTTLPPTSLRLDAKVRLMC